MLTAQLDMQPPSNDSFAIEDSKTFSHLHSQTPLEFRSSYLGNPTTGNSSNEHNGMPYQYETNVKDMMPFLDKEKSSANETNEKDATEILTDDETMDQDSGSNVIQAKEPCIHIQHG